MSERHSALVPGSCFSTARGANEGSSRRRDHPCSGGSESMGGACTCSVPGTTTRGTTVICVDEKCSTSWAMAWTSS